MPAGIPPLMDQAVQKQYAKDPVQSRPLAHETWSTHGPLTGALIFLYKG